MFENNYLVIKRNYLRFTDIQFDICYRYLCFLTLTLGLADKL